MEEKNLFEEAAQELEKSIQEEKQASTPDADSLAKAVVKGVTDAVSQFMKKGAPATDLSLEGDKKVTTTESDPAKSPKKSGQGYKDSATYTSKADDDASDDDDDDDDVPPYFKKKKGKKGKKVAKKSDEDFSDEDTDSDDEVADATEFLEDMGEAVNDLGKSVHRLEEGLGIFGELLADQADPRRDKLAVAMAKSLTFLTEKVTKLEKSIEEQNTMMKAIANMPGAPKVAGMDLTKSASKNPEAPAATTNKLTKGQRDKLFAARMNKSISPEEHQHALDTGDIACIEKK